MTSEESIKQIRGKYCFGCIVNKQKCNELCYFGVALKALEKQMPKKVKGKYPFYCPSCGTKLSPGPYCWKCGQRVEFERREVKV